MESGFVGSPRRLDIRGAERRMGSREARDERERSDADLKDSEGGL